MGTDVHAFDRVCAWADRRQARYPTEDVLVQHGFTEAPHIARGVQLLTPDDLEAVVTAADVVVTHGGPGTISTARAAGHTPVIVPRDPSRGEHVDGHQMRFAMWAAEHQLGRVVFDVDDLDIVVDEDPSVPDHAAPSMHRVGETLETLMTTLTELQDGKRTRRAWPRLRSLRPRRP
ncbi:glycosyltransferase [Microbacterium lacticum]|uniref:glycosyltransferase n=1 Tax=Microbacterium lacticum TaxID=33885 RepID=UPI001F56E3F4|nr:glycosyltransferase [Microbacterium lacticum]